MMNLPTPVVVPEFQSRTRPFPGDRRARVPVGSAVRFAFGPGPRVGVTGCGRCAPGMLVRGGTGRYSPVVPAGPTRRSPDGPVRPRSSGDAAAWEHLFAIRVGSGTMPAMPDFRLVAPFEPTGDQPLAIDRLWTGWAAASSTRRSSARPARARRSRSPARSRPTASRRSSSPTTRRWPPSSTPSSASSSRTTRSSTSSATSTTTSPRHTCPGATPTSRRTRRGTTRSTGSATPPPTPSSSAAT